MLLFSLFICINNKLLERVNAFNYLGYKLSFIEELDIPEKIIKSTAVEQVVACALVTQRARVQSPVRTGFLGEVFLGFFLICKTNVRKL